MNISNYNNEYIKIQSDFIKNLLLNPIDNVSINITGNINCCPDIFINNISIPDRYTLQWKIDFSKAILLENTFAKISLQNILTGLVIDIPSIGIDFAYVNNNCTTGICTLQTFSSHYTPLFKSLIDNWFTANGITSNVTISLNGNILSISNLPDNFIAYSASYNSITDNFSYVTLGNQVFLNADGLFIKPQFFNLDKLIDGVYKFTIKISKIEGFILESNCSFIDITTKCKVASLLQNIKKEDETKGLEQCSTIAHLLHYALVNGSNCGCNCTELCQVYKELYALLNNIDPQIINDCGC